MSKPKNLKTHHKPTVSIFGAGRLGIALGLALNLARYPILSLVGRRRQQLRKAAQVFDASVKLFGPEDLHRYEPAELVLVAVPDDRIDDVAETLGRLETGRRPFVVLHTSGAFSSAIFANLAKKGWHTGSIHPLVSVSDPRAGVETLRRAYWCIEGDTTAIRLARRIVRDLGARSFSIESKDKPLYHAAAVMTSGHVTALFDIALDMLENCGLPRRKARQVLFPLLESTAANLSRAEPEKALTGTFARGDITTLRLHLETLKAKNLEEALKLYLLLGRHSLRLARRKIPADVFEEIRKLVR